MTALIAYVFGPAAGIAIAGSLLVIVVAVLLGGLTIFTSPLIWLVKRLRRRKRPVRSRFRRIVILGFDGLDARLTEAFIAAGKLPHLAELSRQGGFHRLGTTFPAISPAAWASFSTGVWPGKHGIFDFIALDRATYLPELSSFRIASGTTKRRRNRPRIVPLRRGKPFWATLSDHGFPSVILRVPMTFPPDKFRGLQLSGMCLPDLRGSQGTYTIFTTRANLSADAQAAEDAHVFGTVADTFGGEIVHLSPLGTEGRTFAGHFPGPKVPREAVGDEDAKAPADADAGPITAEFRFTVDVGRGRVRVELPDGERLDLLPGEYSRWVTVPFRLGRWRRVTGACRLLVTALTPELEIYATPLMLDPARPAWPISQPLVFAPHLAHATGPFATLGLAEDTWALDDGAITERAFLDQAYLIQAERERALAEALANADEGPVVAVFDGTDRIQHMFWRELETRRNGDETGIPSGGAIADCYEFFDRLVGRVRKKLRPDDLLWVMSDHGFNAFSRQVDVNAWLAANGFLKLLPGATADGWLRGVDWAHTRAFAVGLAGIFFNVEHREAQGIVRGDEIGDLTREICGKLSGLEDAEKNRVAITRVLPVAEANPGPFTDRGPDLLVGYAPGYRVSWATVRGAVGAEIFADNPRRWSGDHGIDPPFVPGVLFSSAKLSPRVTASGAASGAAWQPRIVDLAPTVLALHGIEPPKNLDGTAFDVAGAWPVESRPTPP